jgi:tRNA (guanine-N7-)-methyltransferase
MRNFPRPVYEGGGKRQIRSFVRRQGRMSEAKWRRYEELRPRYCIDFRNGLIEPGQMFSQSHPVVLEIGFGMGHATTEIAEAHPDTNYLGVEVHTPGVAALMDRIEERGLNNLRIIQHDAVEVLKYMIPDGSLSGVHIFFPDPWPKKRHFKRRLIQSEFLQLLAPKIEDGGYVYLATDWEDYAQWMLEHLEAFPGLKNRYDGYAEPQPWRPRTAFEQKGIDKNHPIRELLFQRPGS